VRKEAFEWDTSVRVVDGSWRGLVWRSLWKMLNGKTTKGDFVASMDGGGGDSVNRARVKDNVGIA
jgi:hypothetical protein